jgi:L-ascorbate metabolism protein UlaG (beta-lactamase superfamily)
VDGNYIRLLFFVNQLDFVFGHLNAKIPRMVITYEGIESIKITHGDLTVALNPISKESKIKGSSFGSDIVMISANHPDLNGKEQATRKDRAPFVVDGPGEYEVKGMFIKGFPSKTVYGGSEKINTIFIFEIDSMRIAYFGAISDKDLNSKTKEDLGEIDIVIIPIGGDEVLNASDAYKMAVKREPKLIIPMHFGEVGDKNALKDFLKEAGNEKIKPVEKLTLKRKDLVGKEGEVAVLKSSL